MLIRANYLKPSVKFRTLFIKGFDLTCFSIGFHRCCGREKGREEACIRNKEKERDQTTRAGLNFPLDSNVSSRYAKHTAPIIQKLLHVCKYELSRKSETNLKLCLIFPITYSKTWILYATINATRLIALVRMNLLQSK